MMMSESHHRRVVSENSSTVSITRFNDFDNILFNDLDFSELDLFNLPPLSPLESAAGMAVESNVWGSMPVPVESTVGLYQMPMPTESTDRIHQMPVPVESAAGLHQSLPVQSGHVGKSSMASGGEKMAERRGQKHSRAVSEGGVLLRKAMTAEELDELALTDPKRARRILSNRKSAAKSKERKNHYLDELENKVQMTRIKAANSDTRLSNVMRKITEMAAQNKQMRVHVKRVNDEAQLREELNVLKKENFRNLVDEIEHLKAKLLGHTSSWDLPSLFNSPSALNQFQNPPLLHHQVPQQPQLYELPPLPPVLSPPSDQLFASSSSTLGSPFPFGDFDFSGFDLLN